MTRISFTKMHGAGNDFVVIDNRDGTLRLSPEQIRHIADRHFGVGCDQVIVMEASTKAFVRMRIYNADGGEVASCGNASRCIGWVVAKERGQDNVLIETGAGVIKSWVSKDQANYIVVDMGAPKMEWHEIPLSQAMDTRTLDITLEMLKDPVAVSMGNPHMVFFVEDVDRIPLERLGPILEHHPFFPKRANVSVAQIEDRGRIRLRVWERGAGITLACGTAACATLVAAHGRGLADREARVTFPTGYDLKIKWTDDGHVWMGGQIETVFTGEIGL